MSGVAPTVTGAAVTKDAFTITVEGEIGGATTDIWTMDETKTMANTQDGVAGA